MNPYREPKLPTAKDIKRAQLSMFGVRQTPDGEWKPVLEREEVDPCRECRGYGTHGNPLCGAVYNCKRCSGSGTDPDPATLRSNLSTNNLTWCDKVMSFIKKDKS